MDKDIEMANNEIEKLINSGAPIVKLDIFDSIKKIEISNKLKNHINYTIDMYLDLVDKVNQQPYYIKSKFLETLKDIDIIDSQSISEEDPLITLLEITDNKKKTLDYFIDNKSKFIDKELFILLHDRLLLEGNDNNKTGIRDNNLKFVGCYKENSNAPYVYENRVINYFPIRFEEIDKAIDEFLKYYNNNNKISDKYDCFIKPMIIHGLLSSLQLFKDGNTRYARLIQNVSLWNNINNSYDIDLELPLVYATRQYYGYNDQYRDLVKNIVINNNNEAWEKWFMFNLNRIQDGLMYNENILDEISIKNYNEDKKYV